VLRLGLLAPAVYLMRYSYAMSCLHFALIAEQYGYTYMRTTGTVWHGSAYFLAEKRFVRHEALKRGWSARLVMRSGAIFLKSGTSGPESLSLHSHHTVWMLYQKRHHRASEVLGPVYA
jgi:hypothetical protein